MSTDRELLELAAKAAGVVIDYSHESILGGRRTGFDLVGNAVLDWHNGTKWNPLTDDGDALRLAVKLRLWVRDGEAQDGHDIYAAEDGDDPHAATRRAIVRAAAEVGRAMP